MSSKRISGIYCIENLTTKKKYVGQSVDIKSRIAKHINELTHVKHHNDYLQNAWNKYGPEDFIFYTLEECQIEALDERECYYIELLNTLNRDCGYNLKTGGQSGGAIVSDYVRKKMSDSIKKSYQSNPDLIEQSREKAIEQWSKPEIKEKIMGKNNGMYGRHHTAESIKKMSEKKKGKKSPKRNLTPVLCIELNKIYDCAAEASHELNISGSSILQVCYGNRKTCGGYQWKFMENNIS